LTEPSLERRADYKCCSGVEPTLLVVNRLVKEDFLFELEADAICTPSAKMIQGP
jgi:hypothetical protein